MSDVFISYSHKDTDFVRDLVKPLEAEGFSVWWDHTIPPGKTWDDVIARGIREAKACIIVWSANSVISDWVKEEATLAKEGGKYLPIQTGADLPPMGFRRIQAADLRSWNGNAQDPQWRLLMTEITNLVSGNGGARPPPVASTPPAQSSPPPPTTPIAPARSGRRTALLVGPRGCRVGLPARVQGGSDRRRAANGDIDFAAAAAARGRTSSKRRAGCAAAGCCHAGVSRGRVAGLVSPGYRPPESTHPIDGDIPGRWQHDWSKRRPDEHLAVATIRLERPMVEWQHHLYGVHHGQPHGRHDQLWAAHRKFRSEPLS
jgi:TIR domain